MAVPLKFEFSSLAASDPTRPGDYHGHAVGRAIYEGMPAVRAAAAAA